MRLWNRIRSWLRAILRRSRMERETDTELRFHIEAVAEGLILSGNEDVHQERLSGSGAILNVGN